MNAKERLMTAINLPPVLMNGDRIPACAKVDILETDLNVIVQSIDHVQKSDETATVLVESKSLTQMAREVWHHLQCSVT